MSRNEDNLLNAISITYRVNSPCLDSKAPLHHHSTLWQALNDSLIYCNSHTLKYLNVANLPLSTLVVEMSLSLYLAIKQDGTYISAHYSQISQFDLKALFQYS